MLPASLTFPDLVPNAFTGVLEARSTPVQWGFPNAKNVWYVGEGQAVQTLTELFTLMQPGDVAFLAPGAYVEGNLVIPATLTGITLIGVADSLASRGAAFIEPATVGHAGLQVLANDVTLINIGVASEATGAHSLKIGSNSVNVARFRAYRCKLEGNEAANPAGQVVLQGCGDIIFEDCEIAWGVNGIIGGANLNGFPTQILFRNCWFHDLTTVHVGIAAADHFIELWLRDCIFDRNEAGVAPTDFILLSDNANIGSITGCRFANATNQAAVITIGTGILYMANATEAGWSTARPV